MVGFMIAKYFGIMSSVCFALQYVRPLSLPSSSTPHHSPALMCSPHFLVLDSYMLSFLITHITPLNHSYSYIDTDTHTHTTHSLIMWLRYVPQMWLNFRRKSVKGFSTYGIIIKLIGASFLLVNSYLNGGMLFLPTLQF